MQNDESLLLLRDLLQLSAVELFADFGAQFEPTSSSEWTPDITAVLGVAGTNVAGSVSLCTSHSCLNELARLVGTDMAEDWLGELSNQLVGRFKRRLGMYGVTFGLGTPVVLLGENIRLATGKLKSQTSNVYLSSQVGRVEVWLDMELQNGVTLAAQPQDDGSLGEGEALLF